MDQISLSSVQFNLSSLPFLLLILLLLLLPLMFIAFKQISPRSSERQQTIPPGPKPWPIIGNIPHLGRKPHISMSNLAKIHGPLISLKLGTQLLVVGSSKEAAMEILKTQDRFLSGRYVSKSSLHHEPHVLDRFSIILATQCSAGWKSLRALCRNELFSNKAIESQASLRNKKMKEMVEFLGRREGQVVSIGEVVFATVFNTITNLIFSVDFITLEIDGAASVLKSLLWRMMQLGGTPNIADFFPLGGLDLQGLKRKIRKCADGLSDTWGIYIKERRKSYVHDGSNRDFLDVFLANEFDDLQINMLVLELIAAGTDTTTSTVEWAMAELLRNKEVLKKVTDELKAEMKSDSSKEPNVSQLRYLNACVKETFRLHPPAPLLVPRRCLETCKVMNYTIPKGSQVMVNVWAIGRDELLWEDPLSFRPERFLDSSLDFKGQDFEFLPFGGGRRICLGLPMANKVIPLILAFLVHYFDWSLPNGEDPENLDMNEDFGSTLHKEQPLFAVPKRKL